MYKYSGKMRRTHVFKAIHKLPYYFLNPILFEEFLLPVQKPNLAENENGLRINANETIYLKKIHQKNYVLTANDSLRDNDIKNGERREETESGWEICLERSMKEYEMYGKSIYFAKFLALILKYAN